VEPQLGTAGALAQGAAPYKAHGSWRNIRSALGAGRRGSMFGASVLFATARQRHLGGMPHSHIAPSKWDTSMGTLALNGLAVRRFLRHDLAAVD
jgi:hypothetical protein